MRTCIRRNGIIIIGDKSAEKMIHSVPVER